MNRKLTIVLSLGLVFAACDLQGPELSESTNSETSAIQLRVQPQVTADKKGRAPSGDGVQAVDRATIMQSYLDQVNVDLAARGLGISVVKAEWIGGGDRHEAGHTVYASDRMLRLSEQWIAGDPNRNADGNNLTHVIDQSFANANTFNPAQEVNGESAIDASFDTWNAVNCSNLNVVKLPDVGINYSALLDTGDPNNDVFYADIATIGFLPGGLFEVVLGAGASEIIVGVTFTFIWIDENRNPTDLNGDGYADVALKEIWYNDAFIWATDGGDVDIETVALHENGHALGLGHFGKVFVTNKNNKLHVAPRAVMNAFIFGTLRDPLGTDNGAYCSLYASWPD